ncbi:hypothetical protein ID866_4920 [Astraeus odoratus]|nr:hypothetical protein ID866_4920 [Astraeus odoratus]
MSARLKRKLGDIGVDVSSRRANENFCLIGTPLPPLEKSKDTGEFVPLWKQEVRDEKGRRRLHGAFTGGFSAGYFNTVGSKEDLGWAPSTFVSSRNDRAKARVARPEDFMDEEDLAEQRADQKLVSEHDEMDIAGGAQGERERRVRTEEVEKDPITLALEQAVVPTPKDSVGARILKKMGWKLGWGIGPRVSWRQREIQHGRDPDATEVDEEAKKHTYPPRDTPLVVVDRKDNFHGLGYKKGLGLHASLGAAQENSSTKKGPRLAGGFGLGVMNDADEDDLDVYDHTSGLGKNRTAFDVTDMQDDERQPITARGRTPSQAFATPSAQSRDRQTRDRATFRDGTPVLPGFVLSDKPVAEDMWFPIPDVPERWCPNPKRVWEQAKTADHNKENAVADTAPPLQPQTHTQWKTGITPDQRGAALGETPLPSEPRSVFDYISKKDQERLKNIAANRFSAPAAADAITTPATVPQSASSSLPIPFLEPHTAEAALRGFQPFTSNPTKQARYTTYLRAHAEPGSNISIPPRLQDQNPESYALEMNEYAKAAALFRPVTGAMAGRFTSAAVLELGPKIVEGLHKPTTEEIPQEASPEEQPKDRDKEEDPKVHAARLGMYGPMTREVRPWQPARLLCKRFGVKDPNPDMQFDIPQSSTQGADGPTQDDIHSASVPEASTSTENHDNHTGKRDLANIGLGEDDGQGDDILTYERPAMDIFKAIFASDEENSDEEEESKADTKADDALFDPPVPQQSSHSPTLVQPGDPDLLPKGDGVTNVDMSAFKPTFIPRDPLAKAKDKEQSGKDKKTKKSRAAKGGVLVSFELDEEAGDLFSLSGPRHKGKDRDLDKPKKKRKKRNENKDDDVWVEKPPPEIVKDLSAELSLDHQMVEVDGLGNEVGPPRGRKRAIDFM